MELFVCGGRVGDSAAAAEHYRCFPKRLREPGATVMVGRSHDSTKESKSRQSNENSITGGAVKKMSPGGRRSPPRLELNRLRSALCSSCFARSRFAREAACGASKFGIEVRLKSTISSLSRSTSEPIFSSFETAVASSLSNFFLMRFRWNRLISLSYAQFPLPQVYHLRGRSSYAVPGGPRVLGSGGRS